MVSKLIEQPCACWACKRNATYEKPLCYEHWKEYEEFDLEECSRCHWFYGGDNTLLNDTSELPLDLPIMCDACIERTLYEKGFYRPSGGVAPESRPVLAHADVQRPTRYIYVLKLSDHTFYVGQTDNLAIRLQEHKDGNQRSTKGKHPKLVYFETFEGQRSMVNEREDELTKLNQSPKGQRRLRELIEQFRQPLKLLDLEA